MSAVRQLAAIIYKSRTCVEKLVSQNLEKPENVAYHACKVDPIPGRSRRGERSTGQAGSRLRDKLDVQGIRHGSTPGSSRVRRAGWLRSSWPQRASPQRATSDLGASRFGRRPQPPLSCDLRLNHAQT